VFCYFADGKRFNEVKEQARPQFGGCRLLSFTAFAPEGFPLVKPGDDVARIIVETCERNGFRVQEADVIVAAQKVFSKAEGRVVRLRDIEASRRAQELAKRVGKDPRFVEMVLRETRKVLKASPDMLLVEDVRGLVCINAGIDKSNVEGRGKFALLPENPDRSAEECRVRIKRLTGWNVAVIICDTYSRPFRRGQVNFAIGIAGINPFKDYRGRQDMFGHVLKVKNAAVADEIAAAAELVMGQAKEARPVVLFRGLRGVVEFCEDCSTRDLEISKQEDLFNGTL
jgi:coenzyme F420-0:L-glutamate ligase/coenzyme F420-1:gamma-L-glutamate ligase